MPGYPPAIELRSHLGELLLDPDDARLYADPRPAGAARELRRAISRGFYGAPITAGEVGITSGCNQAFCLALMSIAKAGDQVILPRPHYFNHDMWMRMQGVEPVSLDFRPGSGAVPNAEDAAKLIGPKTRAIVLISPNNPTGAGLSARDHSCLLRAGCSATASPCCWTRPIRTSCPRALGRTSCSAIPAGARRWSISTASPRSSR